jgi:hypothetical protein
MIHHLRLNFFYPVHYPLIATFAHLLIVFLNNFRQERIASRIVPSKRNWIYVVFPVIVVAVIIA